MFKFLTAFPVSYYIIAALLVATLSAGFLLKKEIEKTGKLSAQNAQLTADLSRSEKDKQNLLSTIEVNSQKSLEDQNERQVLKDQVAKANDQISKLKRLTKEPPKDASPTNSDDVYLSEALKEVLNKAYCNTSKTCPVQTSP